MSVIQKFETVVEPFGYPIFVTQTGSHAYGLATETSDEDYKGVFFPNPQYIFGTKTVEQVKVHGDDWVCLELRKFVKLVYSQNPTILELLFIDFPLYVNEGWAKLAPLLRELICRKAFISYSAYVRSQLLKAKFRQPTGKRKELIERYMYDVKSMSHVARLAIQCSYLMKTGIIPVRVPQEFRNDILSIKTGKWTQKEALEYCEMWDIRMHESYKKSVLPESVDFQKFENEVFIPYMCSESDYSYE